MCFTVQDAKSVQKAIGATENLMNVIETENEKELMKGELKPDIKGNVSFEKHFHTVPNPPYPNFIPYFKLNSLVKSYFDFNLYSLFYNFSILIL